MNLISIFLVLVTTILEFDICQNCHSFFFLCSPTEKRRDSERPWRGRSTTPSTERDTSRWSPHPKVFVAPFMHMAETWDGGKKLYSSGWLKKMFQNTNQSLLCSPVREWQIIPMVLKKTRRLGDLNHGTSGGFPSPDLVRVGTMRDFITWVDFPMDLHVKLVFPWAQLGGPWVATLLFPALGFLTRDPVTLVISEGRTAHGPSWKNHP